jgi:Spy/CpxP family protein refolding chaperone
MKNSLKSLVLLLGSTLLVLPALRAEDPPAGGPGGGPPEGRREMRREKMGDRMAQELGLSDDQKAKMKEIDQQEKTELDALRDSATGAKEDRRAQAQAIRKSYMEKRQAIMTPEQREKAKAMREKMGRRMEERRGEGHPDHPAPPADAK